MRTGGYTVHQTLTAEAATTVKHAITLARRRGHAQVTPLHVATTMLASSTGLLQTACLQSHSHPHQCKALELCFNVALNRLPTTTSSPILGPHPHPPSLSNALVAAFKRAQAHQRRGSLENQQQPILALKVELEQLVISILDDPSVSRVMREAGFSSPQVKTKVEQAVSLEICSQSHPLSFNSKETPKSLILGSSVTQFPSVSQFKVTLNTSKGQASSDDVASVLDSLMSKRRNNTIIVGECLESTERIVRGVIDTFDRGDVPMDMRYVQFISLPLLTLKNLPIEEAEKKLEELRSLVRGYLSRGVVLYLGDLKWVSEFWSNYGGHSRNYNCLVGHMVMEISRLLCGIRESGKLWLMGISTFQTYMRCKIGQPSLETLWQLHPLTIPACSLGLSLKLESDLHGESKSKLSGEESSWSQIKFGVEKNLTCCIDCLANFNKEAQNIANNTHYNESTTTSTCSSLPSWLQKYKQENKRENANNQELNKFRELCKKWNSICRSIHKQPHFLEKALNLSSSSASSSTSISSHDQSIHNLHQTLFNWPKIFEPKQSPKEHQFLISKNEPKPDLLSNPNSSPNSASSSEANENFECLNSFKEFNSDNFKVLCNALGNKVPWQKEIIPDIVYTILQCRSKMVPRKGNSKKREEKEETWLFFLGVDFKGKEKIAKELAKIVFGSKDNFVTIGLSNFSSTRADSSEEMSKKRVRDESSSTYLERFAEAVEENPSRLFFMEDLEQVDNFSQKGIKSAIENGRIGLSSGELVPLKDTIVIFSGESLSSISRACSPPPVRPKSSERKEKDDEDDEEERRVCGSLDLNLGIGEESGDRDSVADIGILDSMDRQIIFNIQVL
ncbi:Protein SMAX1-LIKE like [Actinidia chinensis var. chinensis]|uniref:Protein SMAX1-LIKE like n=1 Tax=Actinidia chinensis var. chinensis TaxID=1590841 RepID=A0A2R6PKV7_ACTCC|nr:Protein SMAX1-LIKE like [Actinidia chinensis var. chinensis]